MQYGDRTREEVTGLLEETNEALVDLKSRLSNVEVVVPNTSVQVIKAISMLFGPSYIKSDGSSVITYEMFNKVSQSLREAGKLKVKEYV